MGYVKYGMSHVIIVIQRITSPNLGEDRDSISAVAGKALSLTSVRCTSAHNMNRNSATAEQAHSAVVLLAPVASIIVPLL